ncbi:mannonate dehydratase [Microbacterium sp. NPDC090218]
MQDVDASMGAFARQLGLTGVDLVFPAIPHDRGYWELEDIIAIRERCESEGLKVEVLENVPHEMIDKVILGLPGRELQIENICKSIRNMAAAGITVFGFHFMANGVWRTSHSTPGRGGAEATAFDESLVYVESEARNISLASLTGTGEADEALPAWSGRSDDLLITAEKMWDNYQYFLDGVLPTAAEVGVQLAHHPDDPPVEQIDGIARIFTSPAAFKRAMEMARGNEAWGLDLCLGSVSEMGGADAVHEMIEHFGRLGRIRYVHLRDVQGTVPSFVECFLGEGNYDPAEVIRHLHRVGFDGWLQDDHVPRLVDDTPWAHRSRAYTIGYIQGILSTIES